MPFNVWVNLFFHRTSTCTRSSDGRVARQKNVETFFCPVLSPILSRLWPMNAGSGRPSSRALLTLKPSRRRSAVRVSSLFQVLHGFRVADSVDRIISIISLSL